MRKKQIAILVETALASGREIVKGIARFAHERNDWVISYHTGPLGAMAPSFLADWKGDGIIARIANHSLFETVAKPQVPVVDVLGNVSASPFPVVKSDETAISRMLGEHFSNRGHRHISFFGLRNERWSTERKKALQTFCHEQNLRSLASFEVAHEDREPEQWASYFASLRDWVESLPKPVGIMVASDQFAPDLLDVCRDLNLAVPDQVSVVGVDNDIPFCEICQPRLSSVEPNHSAVGYEAAKLLQAILDGQTTTPQTIEIEPRLLRVRQSSDATAVDDPALVKALRYIRQFGCESIGVDDVAREAGVSRSVLQRRFKVLLDKTVLDAITQVRLVRAKEMLAITSLPLPDVAERSGFKHQEYLGHVFKRYVGQTPGQYRQQNAKGNELNERD